MESQCFSRLLAGADDGERPTLEQFAPEGLYPVQRNRDAAVLKNCSLWR